MSFSRPTLTALIDRISGDFIGRLAGADSLVRRAVIRVLARVHAAAIDGLYGFIAYLARQMMPDTAEAAYLDRWSSIWGVQRKAASPAVGSVAVAGTIGAVIPAGALLARQDGVRYAVVATVTLVDITGIIAVQAVVAGAIGAASGGAILTFVSPASGVNAVASVVDGLSGAADEESDAALLARLLSRIRTPPQGGAESDWSDWALAESGVTRAWAYPLWMGPGTVGLTFVYDGRPSILPTDQDVAAMTAHIAGLRPVTAVPVIFKPTPISTDFLLRAVPDTAAVRAAIVAELDDIYRREAEPGGVMRISRLREAVSGAAGETDNVIFSPAGDIGGTAGALPVLGSVQWA